LRQTRRRAGGAIIKATCVARKKAVLRQMSPDRRKLCAQLRQSVRGCTYSERRSRCLFDIQQSNMSQAAQTIARKMHCFVAGAAAAAATASRRRWSLHREGRTCTCSGSHFAQAAASGARALRRAPASRQADWRLHGDTGR
jgi:hypothetical protein